MTALLGIRATAGGELAALAAAALLGLALVFLAGFAPGLHAAAHDTRHAIAFPCH